MTQAFDELKQQATDHLAQLESKPRVRIGTDLSGLAAGAGEVVEAFRNEVASNKLDVTISEVGGIGLAYAEPLVDIQLPSQPRVFYNNVTPEQVPALVKEHLMGGKPAEGAMAVSGDGDSPDRAKPGRLTHDEGAGENSPAQCRDTSIPRTSTNT